MKKRQRARSQETINYRKTTKDQIYAEKESIERRLLTVKANLRLNPEFEGLQYFELESFVHQ